MRRGRRQSLKKQVFGHCSTPLEDHSGRIYLSTKNSLFLLNNGYDDLVVLAMWEVIARESRAAN